jgi:hypothetical protein
MTYDLFADRSEAPSVAVQSSERGAEHATRKRLTVTQSATILQVLAAFGAVEGSCLFMSRDDIVDAIPTLSVNAACGRLGPTSPIRQDGYLLARLDACMSHAGLVVTGYQISRRGLDLLQCAGVSQGSASPKEHT